MLDDDALRDAIWDALVDPWAVPCERCGAVQWVACDEHEPHTVRQATAAVDVLRRSGALRP